MIRWMIQSTTVSAGPDVLAEACRKLGSAFEIRPWRDDELPELGSELPIYYGSCRFIANITALRGAQAGIFGGAEFSYRRYIEEYGGLMLNADARLMKVRELLDNGVPDRRFFLRSVADSKELAGSLWTKHQFEAFVAGLCRTGDDQGLDLEVLVASRKIIEREWRIFFVDGKISAASQSLHFGELQSLRDVPPPVEHFALQLAARWSPSRVFVMDVGLVDGELRVVELNGFNSCGFYSADVTRIVADVERVVASAS